MKNNKVYLEADVIINTVANYFKLPVENVICTKRKREFIKAKHIAMYYFKQFTDMTLYKIGTFFHDKDHATVLHAIKSVNNQKDVYLAYRNELNEVLKKLQIETNRLDFGKYANYDTDAT